MREIEKEWEMTKMIGMKSNEKLLFMRALLELCALCWQWHWFKYVTTNAPETFHAIDSSCCCRLSSSQFVSSVIRVYGMVELKASTEDKKVDEKSQRTQSDQFVH